MENVIEAILDNIYIQLFALGLALGGGYYTFKKEISNSKVWNKFKLKRSKKPFEPPVGPYDSVYTSKFANARDDLSTVLTIRRAFFGSDTITPDETYYRCWQVNNDSFKIIYDKKNRPVGYWGLIPTLKSTYNLFKRNRLSHSQILENHTLSWDKVIDQNCYLYVIGTVVPNKFKFRFARDNKAIRSTYVITDYLQFAFQLSKCTSIKGVYGYPSEDAGLAQFNKYQFEKNGKFIDNNPKQPICFVSSKNAKKFEMMIKNHLDKYNRYIPVWDPTEKDRFLKNLNCSKL